MRKIKVEPAVGRVLAHDITRIVPGQPKGVAFKKGQVGRPEDIPEPTRLGKKHLCVLQLSAARLHENDPARIAAAIEALASWGCRPASITIRPRSSTGCSRGFWPVIRSHGPKSPPWGTAGFA
jgi:hypothetical protein